MVPILFQLGSITIYSYGFFLTLSYLIGTFIFWREGKRQGYNSERLLDLSLLGLIGALVGGSIYFAVFHFHLFQGDLLSVFAFWDARFSFYGALIGLIVVGAIFTRIWKWPFFQIADIATLAGLVSFVIGKIGAFFAGTDFGTVTSLSWGVKFPNLLSTRHPTQLYEAGVALILFLIFKKVYEDNLKSSEFRSGKVFLLAIFSLSVSRFYFEFFRADSVFLYGLKSAQIVSVIVALISIFTLYYVKLRNFHEDVESLFKFILSINTRVLRKLKVKNVF